MSEIPAVLTPALGSVVGEARQLGDDALIEALRVAEEHDVQVALHTDGLNEVLDVEGTLRAFAGFFHRLHGAMAGDQVDMAKVLLLGFTWPGDVGSLHFDGARWAARAAPTR